MLECEVSIMEHQTFSISHPQTLRVNGNQLNDSVHVYSQPIDKPCSFSLRPEISSTLSKVYTGYTFNILGEERDCYRVELYSGKVGYVLKDKLVTKDAYKYKDDYPKGTSVVRSTKIPSQYIFAVDSIHIGGIV